MCEKTIWGIESNVSTFTVLYQTSPILLTFNILPFFYDWHAFYYDRHIAVCWKIRSVASTEEGDNNDKMGRMWKEATVEYFKVLGNYTYLQKLHAQI